MEVIKEYTNAGTGFRYVVVLKDDGTEVTYGIKAYEEIKKKEKRKKHDTNDT